MNAFSNQHLHRLSDNIDDSFVFWNSCLSMKQMKIREQIAINFVPKSLGDQYSNKTLTNWLTQAPVSASDYVSLHIDSFSLAKSTIDQFHFSQQQSTRLIQPSHITLSKSFIFIQTLSLSTDSSNKDKEESLSL